MVLETERSEVSKTQRAEGVVPNQLRKYGHYKIIYITMQVEPLWG